MPRLRPIALALQLAVVSLGACASEQRPNLILVSVDTLRADHLGVYGYPRDTSPALDAFARGGVVFDRAYSTSNWTLPAHVSMLTGLFANEHGVLKMSQAISSEIDLLPAELGRLGYRSAAVVSAVPFLKAKHGFARGWEVYDDQTAFPSSRRKYAHHRFVGSAKVHRRAVELLEDLGGSRFFLFVHYFDVHGDYKAPQPYGTLFSSTNDARHGVRVARHMEGTREQRAEAEKLLAGYDGEIRWVDSWLERLFAELERRGLMDNSMVVVTSDHGEEFLEHGELFHAKNLYDTSVRVPLIVRFPGRKYAGQRIAAPVSLVDLGATLLAAAGSKRSEWRSGRDLAGLLRPETARAWGDRDFLLTGLGRPGPMVTGILKDGFKIVRTADEEGQPLAGWPWIFPLEGDPLERRIAEVDERERRRLTAALLAAWRQQRAAMRAVPLELEARTTDEEEALRSLGYL